jgi:hypothetical protein
MFADPAKWVDPWMVCPASNMSTTVSGRTACRLAGCRRTDTELFERPSMLSIAASQMVAGVSSNFQRNLDVLSLPDRSFSFMHFIARRCFPMWRFIGGRWELRPARIGDFQSTSSLFAVKERNDN